MNFPGLWRNASPAADERENTGRLTARERLERLFDPGSFVEIGSQVLSRNRELIESRRAAAGDGAITGFGAVNGQTVYAYAQDVSVAGGSLGEMQAAKIVKLIRLALDAGAPVVAFIESGGARIQEGIDALGGYGNIFYWNTRASGKILQISAVMGACAGGAAYSPALNDFIFMVKGKGKMFVTGPDVIRSVTGEQITAEELGGAETHGTVSGVAHFTEDTEISCVRRIRELLDYFFCRRKTSERPDVPASGDGRLRTCVPDNIRRPYDMYEIIRCLTDGGTFLDYMKGYAPNMITCLARVNGMTVGIVANQPMTLAGCIDINGADKAARFVRTCDAYRIPVVSLVDVPGFLPGVGQEHGGIIRHGAKMLYAYAESTVPKVTIIIRKAYGGAYLAMGCRELGADYVFAWPQAEIAVMGAEGAADIIFRHMEPEEKEEKKRAYVEEFSNPYAAAKRGIVDEVIDPGDTRRILIRTLEALAPSTKEAERKRHGNIPL